MIACTVYSLISLWRGYRELHVAEPEDRVVRTFADLVEGETVSPRRSSDAIQRALGAHA